MSKKTSKPIAKKEIKKEATVTKKTSTRTNTKISQLITMIKTVEEGITLKQISENLKWQPHTTRSVISRLNKTQNLGIINDKISGGNRVYKLPKKD
jgi:hypothetical protein